MSESEHEKMSDFEVALMDAIRTICEVLVAKGTIRAEVLAEMLKRQRDAYPAVMPGAAFVMNMILETLTDPERAQFRKLANETPQGSA